MLTAVIEKSLAAAGPAARPVKAAAKQRAKASSTSLRTGPPARGASVARTLPPLLARRHAGWRPPRTGRHVRTARNALGDRRRLRHRPPRRAKERASAERVPPAQPGEAGEVAVAGHEQGVQLAGDGRQIGVGDQVAFSVDLDAEAQELSLIHISEPTRLGMISYAVFCLKQKKKVLH